MVANRHDAGWHKVPFHSYADKRKSAVTSSALHNPAAWGFGLALCALVALLTQLLVGQQHGGLRAWAFAIAAVTSAAWSAFGLAYVIDGGALLWSIYRWSDLMRAAAWIGFILVLLRERQPSMQPSARSGRFGLGAAIVLVTAIVVGGLFPGAPIGHGATATSASTTGLLISLGLAVFGLVCIEQLLRNATAGRRWGITPLAIGLGGMFVFDLYLYADGALFGQLDSVIWSAHGAVLACVTPFVAIATARNQKWTLSLAISRRLVFHTTALLAAASYILGVAALGYLVRLMGGSWGPAAQIVMLAAALMVLGAMLTSGTLRSKLRVLVSKHLFERRYDYREEWLRFTRLVSARDAHADVYERCVESLANLVESPAGAVWVKSGGGYRQAGRWNAPSVAALEPAAGALVEFLARTGWVVDLAEYRRDPGRYEPLRLPAWLEQSTSAWLVIPLAAPADLTGFVVLMAPRVQVDVNWEVLDLLKTAGFQVAALLGQIEANASLLEAEKFAAFNRMSAFVVHDLKNLVAQLSLMLKNAERHGDNAEFRSDMLETVRHVVDRMNGMLTQVRLGTRPVENAHGVDLLRVVRRVCEAKRAQRPRLDCTAAEPITAVGHEDRFEHVLAHVVQNAVDATDPNGNIRVLLYREGANAVIDVVDDGVGISPEFVRQRLFKPFQTTKDSGMGIGVYESHQYVTSLGGQMIVDSTPDAGTCVRIVLPRSDAATTENIESSDVV